MNNEPVAWMALNELNGSYSTFTNDQKQRLLPHVSQSYSKWIPLYTHPAKELTEEDIAKVVHELNQKANTPERWVTAMQIGAETIIQLRDELAILRKASEK